MRARSLKLATLALVPLVLFVASATRGPQLDEQRAIAAAGNSPEISRYAERQDVNSAANYNASDDDWRVAFVQQPSGSVVARAVVSDDTGEVEEAKAVSEEEANRENLSGLTRKEAIKVASADQKVRRELSRHEDGYTTAAEKEDDGDWTVHFYVKGTSPIGGVPQDDGTKEVARVELDSSSWAVESSFTGDQVGWNMARGVPGSYGKQANYWYVWGPMALVFALAFFRNDKVLSWRNLDILALLGFLVSHGFYRAGIVEPAVILWYPPLVYLFVRCLLMGLGVGERVGKTSNFPTWLLFALAALGAGLVLALNTDARVIDVGYAGVAGGELILHGDLPYGNMPSDVGTGDTYGPLNYLLYIPFISLFGFSGNWDFLPAAHALTTLAFVAGAFAMAVCGYRLSGPKAAAAMLFAWCVFPYTLYATNNNTNDILVASAAAISLAVASSPLTRGALIAAGFSIKLYPLILGPLWLLHDGIKRRPIVDFVIGGVAVIVMTFWVFLLGGDPFGNPVENLQLFYQKTLAFQGERQTPWTIFTQLPSLAFLQTPLTIFTVFLAVFVAFIPKKRTVRRLAAFSAALVVLFQITVNYWFYAYITWFEPFVFLALFVATNEKTTLDGVPTDKDPEDPEGAGETTESLQSGEQDT